MWLENTDELVNTTNIYIGWKKENHVDDDWWNVSSSHGS